MALLVVDISVVELCDASSDVFLVSVVKPPDVELSVDGISVVSLCDVEESSVVELSVDLWLLVWASVIVLLCVVSG